MTTKWCNKCAQFQSLSGFYKDRTRADGFDPTCKNCRRENERKRYNVVKLREKRAREPQKTYARSYINNGILTGKIKRQACFLCSEVKAVAHHINYDYPDKVVWLCNKHHGEVHDKI